MTDPRTRDYIEIVVYSKAGSWRDITTNVVFQRTEFVSQVNGQPGTCRIVLLDRDGTLAGAFVTGERIYVKVNDLMVWQGYITRIKRIYPFPTYSPPDRRLIEIEGVDINILFSKRIVLNKDDMTMGEGIDYPPYTSDVTALRDLLDRYLDLSDDDLDVTTQIHGIGTINEDQTAAPLRPSGSWSESMRLIGGWLSPIWYINPDREVVWGDVDVEDAPFALSENPTGAEVGFANLVVSRDASAMINDLLLIGAGNGSDVAVWRRLTDDASIAEHNLSQYGAFIGGVYKQATINRMADSYIYGTTTSRRGHKDDKLTITCTVFHHGLRAGHKVRLTSDVWGLDGIIIPIRQLRLRWLTPGLPQYDLTLTHELDTTWSFFDPYNPATTPNDVVPIPGKTPIPRIPPIPEIPRGGDPPPPKKDKLEFFVVSGQAMNPEDVGYVAGSYHHNKFDHFTFYTPDLDGTQHILDHFTRTNSVAEGWYASSDGHPWVQWGTEGVDYVNGQEGVMRVNPPNNEFQKSFFMQTDSQHDPELVNPWQEDEWALCFRWYTDCQPDYPNDRAYWLKVGIINTDTDWQWWVKVTWNGYGEGTMCDSGGTCADVFVDCTGPNDICLEYDRTGITVCMGDTCITVCEDPNATPGGGGTCDDICADLITDTFTRTIAISNTYDEMTGEWSIKDAWGTSDAGRVWDIQNIYNEDVYGGVDGSAAYIDNVQAAYPYQIWSNIVLPAPELTGPRNTISIDFKLSAISATYNNSSFFCLYGDWLGEDHGVYVDIHNGLVNPYGYGIFGGGETIKSDWQADTWYTVKWEHIVGVSSRMKLWRRGDVEPDWQQSSANLSAFVKTDLTIELYLAKSTKIWFDNLNISGVNACSEYRFDNFNRTITSGLGTSDSGIAWTEVITSGDGSYGVNGTSFYITGTTGGKAVWADLVGHPAITGDFILTARFMTTRVPLNVEADCFFDVGVWSGDDYASVRVSLNQAPAVSYASYNVYVGGEWWDDDYLSVTPLSNTWYTLKWDSTQGVKVWPDGQSEPDWLISHVLPSFARSTFSIHNQASANASIYTDYIDFDYVGKPCYEDCVGNDPFDEFNRTTADGWGSPWEVNAGGDITFSANGSSAVITTGSSGLPTDIKTRSIRIPIASTLPSSGVFRMDTQFRLTVEPIIDFTLGIDLDSSLATATPDSYVKVWNRTTSGGPYLRVSENGTTSDGSLSISVDSTYNLAWERTATVSRAKIWAAGTTEPEAWAAEVFAASVVALDDFKVFVQTGGTGSVGRPILYFNYLKFDYDGRYIHTETFDRSNGPLGTSSSHIPWSVKSGAPVVSNNQGYFPTGSSAYLETSGLDMHSVYIRTIVTSDGIWFPDIYFKFWTDDPGVPGGGLLGVSELLAPYDNEGEWMGWGLRTTAYNSASSWDQDSIDLPSSYDHVLTLTVNVSFSQSESANFVFISGGSTSIYSVSTFPSYPAYGTAQLDRIEIGSTGGNASFEFLDLWNGPTDESTHIAGCVSTTSSGTGGCPEPDIDPIPDSGYTCEEFTGSAGTRVRQLSRPYTVGSVSVWVNGLIQTNFSAPGGTMVTLGFDTVASDTIKICYNIGGTGSGGDSGPVNPFPMPI